MKFLVLKYFTMPLIISIVTIAAGALLAMEVYDTNRPQPEHE